MIREGNIIIEKAGFNSSTDWMAKSKVGMMFHYLSSIAGGSDDIMTPGKWQEVVASFDAEKFVAKLKDVGVGHILFSLGQNSGYYCSPNSEYESVTGYNTKETRKTSERDIIKDILDEIERQNANIKVMLYIPSHPPAEDKNACERFGWTYKGLDGYNPSSPSKDVSKGWYKVIEEWSVRYGDDLAGWWFDGLYNPSFHDFKALTESAKRGNVNSIIASNAGVKRFSYNPYDDYMAGEQQDLSTDIYSKGRWTKGMQNQLLTPMGKNWMQGGAKYTDNQLVDFLRLFNSNESTATFDSPIDVNNGGALCEDHMKQMKRVLSVLNVEDRMD